MANARVTFSFGEYVFGGLPKAQINFAYFELFKAGIPLTHVTFAFHEITKAGTPLTRITFIYKEVLMLAPPEEVMTTLIFPGFGNSASDVSIPAGKDPASTLVRGVGYSVHKKPMFKTNIATASGGFEVRYAMMAYPTWDYELTYEFLTDKAENDALHTMVGFFLQCQGSGNSFLFKDPDDYLAEESLCVSYNNSTSTFLATRTLGGFVEPVGQVDMANSFNVYQQHDLTQTIPTTGPFTITTTTPVWYQDVSVYQGLIKFNKVTGPPNVNEYSITAGVYTFNSANHDESVKISYLWVLNQGTDFTLTLPNRIVLATAPGSMPTYFSGQYYYVCRFSDDQQDYEKFYDKLWSLNECKFRSILQ